MSLATNSSVRPSLSRSAASDAQPSTVGVDDARLSRHVDEPAAVVAEDVVRKGLEVERKAAVIRGVAWDRRSFEVPFRPT